MESNIASIKLDAENCTKPFEFNQIPEKVLENIAKYLKVHQLLVIRSTCRSWKETIDGSLIMNRILVKFPENSALDRKYRPPALVPAKNVCFSKSRISAVDAWWPSVGEKLVELRLNDCICSYAMLLKMLQQCPNLKSLEYLSPTYPAAIVSTDGFQFGKLEKIKIDNEMRFDIVYDFVKMCPNLKHLSFAKSIDDLIQHVDVVKDILVEAWITNIKGITEKLHQLKSLKYLNIGSDVATDQDLRGIAENLPQLKGITVNVTSNNTIVLTFLESLKHLEFLSIKADMVHNRNVYGQIISTNHATAVNFSAFNAKNLKKFHLSRIQLTRQSLNRILKESSNLLELCFSNCVFKNWSEIFSFAEKHKMLRRLELESITFHSNECFLSDYYDSLKYLKLVDCNLPQKSLIILSSLCPELEDVVFVSIPGVDDEVVLELLQSSEGLKKLTLNKCNITDTSIDNIITHGLMLRKVQILNCVKVHQTELSKLDCKI